MIKRIITSLLGISILTLIVLISGCSPAIEPASETSPLATAKVSAHFSDQIGDVTITGHNDVQYVINESSGSDTLPVIDTLLAAQATCAVFVAEKAALELDVPLNGATATSVFDTDTQQVQVYLDLPGTNGEQVLDLANHFRQRCPIYTTLSEAKSVEFTPGEQFDEITDGSSVVTATLFRFGGANVTANGNTFVMDSVPPLDGPNEEINPLDMMLGGLAACSSFAYQSEVSDTAVSVTVEGDFDPTGVRELNGPNPRIQDIRILLQIDEYDEAQAKRIEEQIEEQCYLYTVLEGTVNFDILIEPAQS